MKPTEVLMHEHRVIEQVLDCLEHLAGQCAATGRLDGESANEAIDFFRNFADKCHHRKEEDCLFPALEARGFSRDYGPTGVMLAEHAQVRQLIQAMAGAAAAAALGNREAVAEFVRAARAYSQLLREHIHKEDHCLFRMADQTLSEEQQAELTARFQEVETGHTPGTHQRYLAIADALATRLGVTPRAAHADVVSCCGHHHSQ